MTHRGGKGSTEMSRNIFLSITEFYFIVRKCIWPSWFYVFSGSCRLPRWQRHLLGCQTRCQFHQRFMRVFFVQNFGTKNYKAVFWVWSFGTKNFVQKNARVNVDEIDSRSRGYHSVSRFAGSSHQPTKQGRVNTSKNQSLKQFMTNYPSNNHQIKLQALHNLDHTGCKKPTWHLFGFKLKTLNWFFSIQRLSLYFTIFAFIRIIIENSFERNS